VGYCAHDVFKLALAAMSFAILGYAQQCSELQ
jgi:hypothetical protein